MPGLERPSSSSFCSAGSAGDISVPARALKTQNLRCPSVGRTRGGARGAPPRAAGRVEDMTVQIPDGAAAGLRGRGTNRSRMPACLKKWIFERHFADAAGSVAPLSVCGPRVSFYGHAATATSTRRPVTRTDNWPPKRDSLPGPASRRGCVGPVLDLAAAHLDQSHLALGRRKERSAVQPL